MTYTVYNPDGQPVCGDASVDKHMRARCDSLQGHIKDDATGDVVYPIDQELE